jgi:CheY-like chemotaxis protein
MDTKLRILVVEDDASFQQIARLTLEPYATVIIAGSVARATFELRSNDDFALIILDGRVPQRDNEPLHHNDTTLLLAQHIMRFYNIPTYAASSDDQLNRGLAKRGCIHTDKLTALQKVKEVLMAATK